MIEISKPFASFGRNLGNKLFTYGISRMIAEKNGYKLVIPENSLIRRSYIPSPFPFGSIDGEIITDPIYHVDDGEMIREGIEGVLMKSKNKHTLMDGYFLKYENIKNEKERLKNYYSSLIGSKDNSNDVIILLRDSDYDSSYKLPDSYYLEILENLNFDKLYVSFDHYNKHLSLFNNIKKYDPIFLDLEILDLFKTITTKKIIIASQGTFSFWTCYLSHADKIYWPVTTAGPNKTTDPNINLIVDDDNRYNFINTN